MTSEPTGFLYPFIEAEERGASDLVADLAASAAGKIGMSRALRLDTLHLLAPPIATIAVEMAARFRSGGRLFAFGNGGSATDADGAVELFSTPPHGEPLPAISFVEDRAVVTALANDVGFDLVFSRQIIAYGRAGDMAMGFSTSGDSVNVLKAFAEAADRGIMTVGFSGYDGGTMATSAALEHCLVVPSDSVHRIQETQDALLLEIWRQVQGHLSGALVEAAP